MIKLQNICKVFNQGRHNEKIAIKYVSLNIDDGELVAVIGKSGAGKTTLINIIGCLDAPTGGSYFLNGRDVTDLSANELANVRHGELGFINQSPFLINEISVLENVLVPLMLEKCKHSLRIERATQALCDVGMNEFINTNVSVLSGGEKQRVSIARALAHNPNVILADEPTGSLDEENASLIMEILKKINNEGKTVIIITHDLDIANTCDRIIELKYGEIKSDSKTSAEN
ncbi:MAG: ABC transporter ATP-binding protein [Clostridia bacterium]